MTHRRTDRRQFLQAMGVAVPASIDIDWDQIVAGFPQGTLSPRDVFEIYVAECLRIMPQKTGALYPGGLATEAGTVLRALIEVQGEGLAAVLAELQHREQ
jgi:hypothetical protein